MSSPGWRRLSARQNPASSEALMEGVPPHLYEPVLDWVANYSSEEDLLRAAVAARLPLGHSLLGLGQPWHRRDTTDRALANLGPGAPEKLLDLLDAILALLYVKFRTTTTREHVGALETLLELGGSAWRVNSAGSGLERRVDQTVKATVEKSMAAAQLSAPSAATHLAEAWRFAYGRSPNASKVFSESIKAVEAAAAPVVIPNDLKATLGKIIGEMRGKQGSWIVAIANTNAQLLIDMMESLWNGQTDRHGGVRPTIPVTTEAAEAALHMAATLVHWFTTGAVSKK